MNTICNSLCAIMWFFQGLFKALFSLCSLSLYVHIYKCVHFIIHLDLPCDTIVQLQCFTIIVTRVVEWDPCSHKYLLSSEKWQILRETLIESWQDLNRKPLDLQSPALPFEPTAHWQLHKKLFLYTLLVLFCPWLLSKKATLFYF